MCCLPHPPLSSCCLIPDLWASDADSEVQEHGGSCWESQQFQVRAGCSWVHEGLAKANYLSQGPPGRALCGKGSSYSPSTQAESPSQGLCEPHHDPRVGVSGSVASWVWVWGSRQRFPMPFFQGLNFPVVRMSVTLFLDKQLGDWAPHQAMRKPALRAHTCVALVFKA